MDFERYFRKTHLNLMPPPPKSLNKLQEEEIREVTDYIYEHAMQTYNLIKEDAERQNENWKLLFWLLAKICYVAISLLFIALVFVILYMH